MTDDSSNNSSIFFNSKEMKQQELQIMADLPDIKEVYLRPAMRVYEFNIEGDLLKGENDKNP